MDASSNSNVASPATAGPYPTSSRAGNRNERAGFRERRCLPDLRNDFPSVVGVTIFGAFFIAIADLCVDVAYATSTPRVRFA